MDKNFENLMPGDKVFIQSGNGFFFLTVELNEPVSDEWCHIYFTDGSGRDFPKKVTYYSTISRKYLTSENAFDEALKRRQNFEEWYNNECKKRGIYEKEK